MKPLTTKKWRSIKEFFLLESWNDGSRQERAFRITPWSWISELSRISRDRRYR